MLIWYSNQPEETRYFIERIGARGHPGPYKGIFFLNLIINFVAPILLLMRRGSKRNYTMMTFMAVLIIFFYLLGFFLIGFSHPPADGKKQVRDITTIVFYLCAWLWIVWFF